MSITVAPMLQILPNRTVMIPGCEPPSAVSSLRFSAWYQENGCNGGLVDVDAVLAAIPGSTIVYGTNYGPGNWRQQWLRLPGRSDDCPCPPNVDYYAIMKNLPRHTEPEPIESCDLETSDWCGGCGGSDDVLPVSPDPYIKMGQQTLAHGTLNQIPPYMVD